MPISKSRKKSTPKRKKQQVSTRQLFAGAQRALQVVNRLVADFHTEQGPEIDTEDEVHLQGFFLGYDRACKNAGVPYDVQPAVKIINMIHYGMPMNRQHLLDLKAKADELWAISRKIRDPKVWSEALTDLSIYCHMHNFKWVGIGEAEMENAGTSPASAIA